MIVVLVYISLNDILKYRVDLELLVVYLSNIYHCVSLLVPFHLFFLRVLLDLQILNENSMIPLAHMTARMNKLVRNMCWCFQGKSLFPVDICFKSN